MTVRLTPTDEAAQRRVGLLRVIAYLVSHPERDSLALPLRWQQELETRQGLRWVHLSVDVDEVALRAAERELEARHGLPPTRVVGAAPASPTLSLLRALMHYEVQEDDLQMTQDPRRDAGGGIPTSVTDIEGFRRTVTFSARHNRLADFELQLPR